MATKVASAEDRTAYNQYYYYFIAANIKNVILHNMTLPKCQYTAEQYHIFIFAVFDV